MNDQPQVSTHEPALLAGGIFVVQLRSDSDVARQCLRGRIEHVVSGGSQRFDSLADLLTFMARHLGAAGADASACVSEGTERVDHHGH